MAECRRQKVAKHRVLSTCVKRYNTDMDAEEKKWERIRDVLISEGTGKATPRISSTRTLFGIPSAVDEAIEAIVAEDEARRRAEARKTGPKTDTPNQNASGK